MEFLTYLRDYLITLGLPQEAVGSVTAGHVHEAVFPAWTLRARCPVGTQ